MNGAVTPDAAPVPMQAAPLAPAVTINQINLTWPQILSAAGSVIAAIWSAYAAGWLFLPAKESELKEVTKVVEVLQTGTKSNREAIERLTVAVDNLSTIVERINQAQIEAANQSAVVPPRPVPARPRAAPANRP